MTQTTWGYRFWCPQCGHEGVTQDANLRENLIDWHESRAHDGADICEWDREEAISVDEFPADETPQVGGSAVEVTTKTLGVVNGD